MRRLARDGRGAVAIIVALVFPVIFGIAALTVDIGHVLYMEAKLQAAADAAALAAASSLDDEDAAVDLAEEYAGLNMPEGDFGTVLQAADVVFGTYDIGTGTFTADDTPTDAVRVTLNLSEANGNAVTLFFAQVIGFTSRDVQSQAIATQSAGEGQFCFLATEEEEEDAFKVSGSAELNLGDCGIAVASTDDNAAMKATGSAGITASTICVAGGFKDNSDGDIDPPPDEGCTDIPDDPLAGLTAPEVEDCGTCSEPDCFPNTKFTGNDAKNITLSPGTYCGGIKVSGSNKTITFEPGVYVLAGGNGLKVSGRSNTLVNETDTGIGGVMFFNTEEGDEDDFAELSFSASGGRNNVNLSAPTSGTYEGVLFFQDPDADSAASDSKFDVSGNVDMELDGVVYMPDHEIDYSGTSSIGVRCTKLIGDTIEFSGATGSEIPESCVSDAVSIGSSSGVRLRG